MFWKRTAIVLTLLPTATVFAGQSSASADSVTGVVRAVPDVGLRAEPRADSPVPTRIPTGHQGTVSCYVRGSQNISGWGGTNPYWNYTHIDGRTGYIPDVWLDTGGDITDQVPECDQGRKRPEEPGQACVLLNPQGEPVAAGRMRLGRVGWGFKDPGNGRFYYGATESSGLWMRSGSWREMIDDFNRAWNTGPRFKCTSAEGRDARAVLGTIEKVRHAGYDVRTNNSMDHAYRILDAYGAAVPAPITPSDRRPISDEVPAWAPVRWFGSLPWKS
ncbi:hypothetical protein [Streptosporangium sp. NPDC000396]|uniref:hypothetical protein n=1 Tax=Streptosporangium sp. NPDC000396 TaxID=3366185 RepID=UPI0036BDE415